MKFIRVIKAAKNIDGYAYFVRKPQNLKEVETTILEFTDHDPYKIAGNFNLTEEEYNKATEDFFNKKEWAWIQQYGGFEDECRVVAEVTCPGKPTLLIDSQGFDYARYVAIRGK